MLTYHGVLAPAASRRDEIVPVREMGADAGTRGCSSKDAPDGMSRKRQHPERLPWADLVRRVWLTEILRCPCGGRRAVLAMVFDSRC